MKKISNIKICLLFLFLFAFCQSNAENISYIPDENGNLISQEQVVDPSKKNRENIEYEEMDSSFGKPAETPDYLSTIYRMAITLVLIVLFLIATVFFLRRLSKARLLSTNETSGIKILEKRAISPKSSLYLLQVLDEKVLVSESHLDVKMHPLKKKTPSRKKEL